MQHMTKVEHVQTVNTNNRQCQRIRKRGALQHLVTRDNIKPQRQQMRADIRLTTVRGILILEKYFA